MTSAIVDAILGTLPGVEPSSFQTSVHTPNTNRTLATSRFMIGFDGTLTGVEVVATSGEPNEDVYVRVVLEDDMQIERGTLFRGYMDTFSSPHGAGGKPVKATWRLRIDSMSSMSTAPNLVLRGTFLSKKRQAAGWTGTDEASTSGQGKLRQITGTNPAAGVEVAETVPTGARWKVNAIKLRLVASTKTANRNVNLNFNNVGGSNTIMNIVSTYNQTANQDPGMAYRHWAVDSYTARLGNSLHMNLPTEIWLLAGEQFVSSTTSMKVDDNFDAPVFTVFEWLLL